MPAPWDQLLGPAGLAVGAILALGVLGRVILQLWRELQRAGERDRADTDRALALLQQALNANLESAEAGKAMAAAWVERNRMDGERSKADARRRRQEP